MFIDLHCPAELRGYEITIDKKKNLTSCALTLFNLDDKEISSVEVQLKCFDSFGEPVGEPTSNELTYHLQDLNAKGKSFFGESNPIPLPDHPTTRTVSVTISRVKFVDGALWTKGDYQLYDVSTERLTGKALEELRTLVGEDAICYARKEKNYWQCVCGRANLPEATSCVRCGQNQKDVIHNYTSEIKIIKIFDEYKRIKKEEDMLRQNREREEEVEKEKRTNRKLIMIAVIFFALINIVFWSVVHNEFKPIIITGRDYDFDTLTFKEETSTFDRRTPIEFTIRQKNPFELGNMLKLEIINSRSNIVEDVIVGRIESATSNNIWWVRIEPLAYGRYEVRFYIDDRLRANSSIGVEF